MGSPSPNHPSPHPVSFQSPLPPLSTIDSLMPSSSRSLEVTLASPVQPPATKFAGDESPSPDPRWPRLNRWSVKRQNPPVMTSTTTSPVSVAATPSLDVSQGQGEPPLENPVSVQISSTESDEAFPSKGLILETIVTSPSSTKDTISVSATENNVSVSAEELAVSAQVSDKETAEALPIPSKGSTSGNSLIPLSGSSNETKSAPNHSLSGCQGAWAQPIKFSETLVSSDVRVVVGETIASLSSELWPSLSDSQKGKAVQIDSTRKSYKTVVKTTQDQTNKSEDDLRFPWAARMNPNSRNLYRATEPEYLADGTPKVTIPKHVLLQGLENQREYIIGQFYRCSLPPGGLIFAVFNKLWGRKCRISIRKLGESNYLFHIPDEATRNWVLQRGLWHVDDCLMFVASWTPEATLAIPEIKTIPVWVTLKKIPNICYSIAGISHIAYGLGAPMATHKPRLDPILMGEAKILVEVELSKAFPPRIAASDENGFISMVDVEYAWLPTNCSRCGQLGHKVKRCLQSTTANEVEDGNVTKSIVSDPVETSEASASVHAATAEVVTSTNIILPIRESIIIVTDPIPLVAENAKDTLENSTALPNIESLIPETASDTLESSTMLQDIESPTLETAPVVPPSTSDQAHGSNRFASLASIEVEEDLLDSDEESDSMDHMTPLGQRILRERPVKPSAKAKEMSTQLAGRGRGNQGRGKRGGRG